MANIRPNQLPPATAITNNDRLIIDQGAAGVNAAPPKSILDTFAPVATQSEAEAGTDNVKRMTPLRAQQHLLAQGVPNTRTVTAGDGLTGGGTLEANRTLALSSTSLASLAKADSAVQSVNGKTGSSVTLTKSDVGLGNVDNTSDADKPISTATQTALNAKANSAVTITAGSGLTGGGNLTANRTIALNSDSIASLGKADTALQAPGGTAGQVLAKNSADDNDVSWVTSEAATAVSYGPQTLTPAQQVQARQNIQADKSYDSIASVAAATVPAFANAIRTNGYYAAGDGGAALYKRVVSEPTHAGKVMSADGAWWELAEIDPNVKMFGAVGDGVANDQAEIVAAVNYAYSSGSMLYWPAGEYLSTASIPLFHQVKHSGHGVVKRGGETFAVSNKGSHVNKLFVATGGHSANDGLSASSPIATVQKAMDVLANYGPVLQGVWEVNIAAGRYYTPAAYPENLQSEKRVFFKGPDAGRSEPLVKIDGSASSDPHGWWFQTGAFISIHDIEFCNWTRDGYGLLFNRQQWDVHLFNVWSRDNSFGAGFIGAGIVQWRWGVVSDNAQVGVLCQDRCRHTIGWGATTVYAGTGAFKATDGLYIARNGTRGADFSRLSYGYLQRCLVEGNQIGAFLHKLTRARLWENHFKNNIQAAFSVSDNCIVNQTNNTYEGNTDDGIFFAGGVSGDDSLASVRNLGSVGLLGTATGTYNNPAGTDWAQHVPQFASIPAGSIRSSRGMVRVKGYGLINKGGVESGRSYNIRLYLGLGAWVAALTIPSDVNIPNSRFELEFVFSGTGPSAQKGFAKITTIAGSFFSTVEATRDLYTGNNPVTIWTSRENVNDTMVFQYVTAEIFGEFK